MTVGIALSLALALFSYVRISSSGLIYRGSEVWANEATLAFSSSGSFEWRADIPESQSDSPARIPWLVEQYSIYATSDTVLKALQKQGLLKSKEAAAGRAPIEANVVPSMFGSSPIPFMKIVGKGDSPAAATRLTVAATDAFIAYLGARQDAAGIRENQRVQVQIVDRYRAPMLIEPRSKIGLLAILLAGLTATVAAAFIRDNVQRTKKRADDPDVPSLPDAVSLAAVNIASKPVSPLADVTELSEEELPGADRKVANGGAASRWAPRAPR